MAKYEFFYLATGINYLSECSILEWEIERLKSQENPDTFKILEAEKKLQELNKISDRHYSEMNRQELKEQLDKLSNEGWELVQMPQSLLEGKVLDGYAIFRKE